MKNNYSAMLAASAKSDLHGIPHDIAESSELDSLLSVKQQGDNSRYLDFLKIRLTQAWHNLLERRAFNDARIQVQSAPNLVRRSIKPQSWYKKNRTADQKLALNYSALLRRSILLILIVAQTVMGTSYLSSLLPYQGWGQINFAQAWSLNSEAALYSIMPYVVQSIIIGLFAILFAWISIGFWTAVMGIILSLFGWDKYTIKIPKDPAAHINPSHRTALVMPICNEDVARVFAGLRATWQSLNETGQLGLCDFYILSDTNDADLYANELKAWARFIDEVGAASNVFYRHRERRVKRKSGNIDDFCRRWGGQYEYMMILDADSVMTGDCIVNMVAMMELKPKAGIIQSPPKTIRMRTLYGRVQQFANQTYSNIFSGGTHFWQLSEAQYWGHNAIIRLKPFIEHCILTPFHKRGQPLHILSHDLVEAALMRRAGWQVWIAYNLNGSYEEVPANMIEDLKRDNRWCIGNLINVRVLPSKGLSFVHRVMFTTSAMAYVSSFLWLLFLFFSTLLLLVFNVSEPQYFLRPNQFYPVWPRWDETLALKLLCTTFGLLFAPKIFSYFIVLLKQGPQSVGGTAKFTVSVLLEMLCSVILAPIRMIFHSKFVIKTMIGSKVQWKSPARSDDALTWKEAFYFCWPLALLGLAWLWIVLVLNPQFTTWFAAILIPLIISPFVVRYSSLTSIGISLEKAGVFLTVEEVSPNRAIIYTDENLVIEEQHILAHGYLSALIDPSINALVCAVSTTRHHENSKNSDRRELLIKQAIESHMINLTNDVKLKIMADPYIFATLHAHVWLHQELYADLFALLDKQ